MRHRPAEHARGIGAVERDGAGYAGEAADAQLVGDGARARGQLLENHGAIGGRAASAGGRTVERRRRQRRQRRAAEEAHGLPIPCRYVDLLHAPLPGQAAASIAAAVAIVPASIAAEISASLA